MESTLLDLIFKGLNKYAENHKGEYPLAITLHTSKKAELHKELSLLSCNSAVYFNHSTGYLYIFGVQVYFSKFIHEDNFILSENKV